MQKKYDAMCINNRSLYVCKDHYSCNMAHIFINRALGHSNILIMLKFKLTAMLSRWKVCSKAKYFTICLINTS